MAKYDFFELHIESGLEFLTTDSSQAEILINELKSASPKTIVKETKKLPSGQDYYYKLEVYLVRPFFPDDFLWLVISLLCSRGWEPLGSFPDNAGRWNHYQFKRLS